MRLLPTYAKLARNDFKLIGRDSFLVGMFGYIVFLGLMSRILIPRLRGFLLNNGGFDLEPYYPLLVSWIAVMVGVVLAGTFVGFLLIDERDERTMQAILVTPLPLSRYLAYRVGFTAVLAVPIIVGQYLLINLALFPLWKVTLIAVAGAPAAATMTLVLPIFSPDKVQAFALLKIVSISTLLPLAAYFVDVPWQYLAGVYPPYWLIKAYWVAHAGGPEWWVYLVIGSVSTTLLLWWFVRRFQRIVHR